MEDAVVLTPDKDDTPKYTKITLLQAGSDNFCHPRETERFFMRETDESALRLEQKRSLLEDIAAAKSEMSVAQKNFDCVCSPSEVDIYIYRLRAAEAHYGALLKKLKDLS